MLSQYPAAAAQAHTARQGGLVNESFFEEIHMDT